MARSRPSNARVSGAPRRNARLPAWIGTAFVLLLLCSLNVGAQTEDAATLAIDDTLVVLSPGDQTEIAGTLTLRGLFGNHTIVYDADIPTGQDWIVMVTPSAASLTGSGTSTFTLTITTGDRPTPHELPITLTARVFDQRGTQVASDTIQLDGRLVGSQLILDRWDNPFPAPLDNAWGAFLGNLGAWLLISTILALLIDPTLRALTFRTKTKLDDKIIHILRFPAFLVLFAFGAKQSLAVFDLPLLAFTILDKLYFILIVVAAVYTGYRVWQEIVLIVGRRLASRTETHLDDRLLPVLEKTGGVIIVVVGAFYILDSLGINMTLFAAGGAVTGLVIAFAAQDTLSNFFSGIFLMLDQPFKEGEDIILDSGEVVEVRSIGLRTTELYHKANHETIIIPNNLLATNRTINLLRPDNKYKVRVDVGVAYGSDVQLVKKLLLQIVTDHNLTLKDADHEPFVRFQAFGASSLDFSVHTWVADVYSRWLVASDIREAIDEEFAKHNIEIPFPQRVVWQGPHEAAKLDEARRDNPRLGPRETADRTRTPEQASHQVGADAETGGGGGDGGDDI